MTKEKLVLLLEKTLREMPQSVDGIYATKKLFSALSSTKGERIAALAKLYDISLYVSLLSGDFVVLFHQFLSSDFLYERKYAMAKLYPLMNEGFKRLYGFVNENTGQVRLSSDAYWKDIQEFVPLMNETEKALYDELEDVLLKKASYSWWKDVRDAEVHLDAEKIYKNRCDQEDENVSIRDAMSFYDVLSRTTHLMSLMLSRLSEVHLRK
jgi:hypothetical protein